MQNLLTSLKDGKQENILACSKRIIGAVRELILLFPEVQNNFTKALFKIHSKPIYLIFIATCKGIYYYYFFQSSGHPEVSEHISSLQSAAHEYRVLVLQTVKSNTNNSKSISLELLECAFDIAKSARQLENYFR